MTHLRVAAAVAEVLRLAADHHARVQVVVLAQRDVAHKRDVVFQPRAAADPNMGPDHAERPDLHVGVDFRAGMNRHVVGDVTSHDSRSGA